MTAGRFIALEGIDGAGTTTHTKLLIKALAAAGVPAHSTREPSDGPIGVTIRQALSGRLVVPSRSGGRPPGWKTMALLFAADRLDHIEAEVEPNLREGVTVLTDRYDYSSVGYQSLTAPDPEAAMPWIRSINQHAKRPDLTLVLNVPAEVAADRRNKRSSSKEIYDDDGLQAKLAKFYASLEQYFPADNIVHVNADQDMEVVAAEILGHVRELGLL